METPGKGERKPPQVYKICLSDAWAICVMGSGCGAAGCGAFGVGNGYIVVSVVVFKFEASIYPPVRTRSGCVSLKSSVPVASRTRYGSVGSDVHGDICVGGVKAIAVPTKNRRRNIA